MALTLGKHPSDSEIGIDAGIDCFAAFSDGTMVKGVHSFRRHEDRLVREQRKLSRGKKKAQGIGKSKGKRYHGYIIPLEMSGKIFFTRQVAIGIERVYTDMNVF